MKSEPTIRALHNASIARLLEAEYGLPEGSIRYIEPPYEEEKRPVQEKAEEPSPVKERGRKRRKL